MEYTAGRKIGAKTLFATHYHELTSMEESYDGIVNYHIAAKKRGDSITFLRKIVRGSTDDSYGIEVAKLAGLPNEVIKRAREVLAHVEESSKAVRDAVDASGTGTKKSTVDDGAITMDDMLNPYFSFQFKSAKRFFADTVNEDFINDGIGAVCEKEMNDFSNIFRHDHSIRRKVGTGNFYHIGIYSAR